MSAFRGGFGRAAASSLAGASLAQLASLVDRSLLSWDGAGRYHLHPLLQRFLEEKAQLDPARAADVLERTGYLELPETLRRHDPRARPGAGRDRLPGRGVG
ncbi:MAG: hypothetical protein U5J97_02845 [Trueperaceae bacterium]|nr:hypothetical protein [Trueperaceae bacterium]